MQTHTWRHTYNILGIMLPLSLYKGFESIWYQLTSKPNTCLFCMIRMVTIGISPRFIIPLSVLEQSFILFIRQKYGYHKWSDNGWCASSNFIFKNLKSVCVCVCVCVLLPILIPSLTWMKWQWRKIVYIFYLSTLALHLKIFCLLQGNFLLKT